MLQHLRPQYAAAFRCIGSDCEDTCCHGLDVVVDQTAYGKFQSLGEFDSRLKPHLVLIQPAPSQSRYARIQLTPAYSCPFLTAERLCGIQQEFGEFYLADICASYPRITQRIDGLRETALLLSCPEAARLVLLHPDLVPEAKNENGKVLPRYYQFAGSGDAAMRAALGASSSSNRSPHQYLWDIRGFTLLLLKDRAYPLWQRVFLLGMFAKRLAEITAAGELGCIPGLLHDFADLITQGKLRADMDAIPARSALQLGVVLEVLDRHLAQTDVSHVRFRECVQDFLAGIHYDASIPLAGGGLQSHALQSLALQNLALQNLALQNLALQSLALHYENAHALFYQPLMRAHPHILENYLVNYVFRTRFPYGVNAEGQPNDALTEFLLLLIFFSTIQSLLIGISGHYREAFAPEHVVKLVQSFAKAVEQSPKFAGATYRGLATADGMALLLKNG